MFDLHSHILCGLDDGAESMEEAEKMFARAGMNGIHTICATSHYSRNVTAEKYNAAFDAAKVLAEKHGINLLPGMEYDLCWMDSFATEEIRTIGSSSCILVDMNQDYLVHSMVNLFFEFKLKGFKIIFAHPERMLPPKELDKLMKLLKENDIYIQVDTGSLVGRYGSLARSNAFRVMDAGGCHLLANDAHKARHFLFPECKAIVEKRYGKGVFELLTEENPKALFAGEDLIPSKPRKTFFQRLFSRA
ncbi:MAG: hypothetical protein IKB22_04595 [Lentisphaeria bacterium]|nr:hypothetical protein [Lentisphaeria bacterium]